MHTTDNGAMTLSTSGNPVVDCFAALPGLRGKTAEITKVFEAAYRHNPLDALKILFYARDIRGGQGERSTFRTIISWLAQNHPEALINNLENVPEYGRWDDLFSVLAYDQVADKVLSFIIRQITKDLVAQNSGESVSLLGKWLPREGSKNGWAAHRIMKACSWRPKKYRQVVVSLSKTVEQQMCARQWEQITFEHVPSVAMKNYRKAFARHDAERWIKYLADLKEGKTTVHGGTLYPHNIVGQFLDYRGYKEAEQPELLEAQWKALPDYLGETNERILPICDVSGSMYCGIGTTRPIEIAVALSLYIAERNRSFLHNLLVTFHDVPELIQIPEAGLSETIRAISQLPWGGTTNFQATFEELLRYAVENRVAPEDMPSTLICISDMEFNQALRYGQEIYNVEAVQKQYADAGYQTPKLIFWNVNSRTDNYPARYDEKGVMLVSGSSPSVLKSVLSSKLVPEPTPEEAMRAVIDQPRYDRVSL